MAQLKVPEFKGNIPFSFGLEKITPADLMRMFISGKQEGIILTSSGEVPTEFSGDYGAPNGIHSGQNWPSCLQFAEQIARQNNWQFFEAPSISYSIGDNERTIFGGGNHKQNARRRTLDFSRLNNGLIYCLPNLQELLKEFGGRELEKELEQWTKITGDLRQDEQFLKSATIFTGDVNGLVLNTDKEGKYSNITVQPHMPSMTGMRDGNHPWYKIVHKIVRVDQDNPHITPREIEVLTRVGREFAEKLTDVGRERTGVYFCDKVGFVVHNDNCSGSGTFNLPLERMLTEVCLVADYVSKARQAGIERYNSGLAEEVARRHELVKG